MAKMVLRRSPLHSRPGIIVLFVGAFPLVAGANGRVLSPQGIRPSVSSVTQSDSARRSQDLFNQAAELIKAGRYSAAVTVLRQAATLTPEEASVHHYLGYAFWRLNQWKSAQKEFETARQLDPKNPYTCYFLAHIEQWEGHLGRSIALYEEVLRLGPAIYDTNQLLGQAYLDKGELLKARQRIEAALRQTPWDGSLYYQLGRIDQRQGKAAEAREEFAAASRLKNVNQASIEWLLDLSQAIKNKEAGKVQELRATLLSASSQDPEILDSLGVLLGRGGLYEDALDPLQRSLRQDPNSFEASYNLGLTLFRLGRYNEAEEHLKQALALEPQSSQVNILLGLLYVNQNRRIEAIERLRAANQASPENARILALLGEQYLAGHFVVNAVSCLEEAIKLNPHQMGARYLLIEAYQQENDFPNALKAARQAAQESPTDARSVYEVGQQSANLGDYQQARDFAERAIQMDASLVEAYDLLGDTQSKEGEYGAALDTFERARTLDPKNTLALRGIAQNLIRLRRYPEALAKLKQATALEPRDSDLYFDLMQVYVRLGQSKEAAEAEAAFQRLHAEEVAERNGQAPRVFKPSTVENERQ